MGTALDETTDGTTELRIHGVSGTPAESMLDHPHPRLVSGDRTAGFFRRWFPAQDSLDVPHRRHLEAYSWGGLTSGAASRALWLLLLPFLLVNVASWMEPGAPDADVPRRRRLEALLRLFAVSLTGTLVLAAAGVGMDLWAWQCGGAPCADAHVVSRFFLGWPAGRRLAVGVLVPALALGLLWYLANRTWTAYESRRATQPHPGGEDGIVLADPRMWRGEAPVRRMRAIHLVVGWSLLAVLTAWPLADHLHDTGSAWQSVPVVVVVAAVVLAALAIGTLLHPRVADRVTPRSTLWPDRAWQLAPWAALGLLVTAAVLAALPWAGSWGEQRGSLPLFVPVLVGGFLAQFGTLVVMAALTSRLPGRRAAAMRGYAGPVVVAMGWLLAGGFSAGLALRIADYLGTPVADLAAQRAASRASDPLIVPAPYAWVGMLVPLLLVPCVAALRVLWRRAARLNAAEEAVVGTDYAAYDPPTPEPADAGRERTDYLARRHRIARTRALAAMTDHIDDVVLLLVTVVLVALGLACVGYVVAPDLPAGDLAPLTTAGTWLVGAVALLLVGLGRSVYRRPQLRRTVGIAWDLGSFWPRAAHPLAPPCYCERVLPDLVDRSAALTRVDTDRLILSAHSQGTVIAVAAILQLPQRTVERTGLLTYGSPLRRLYAAWFPGYFGDATFAEAANRLGRTLDGAPTTPPGEWPWRNLYRRTDPIGGFVLGPAAVTADDEGTVDRQLVDPVFSRPFGDSADPLTYGHSSYPADAAFAASVPVVEELLERRRDPLRGRVPAQQPATPAP